jgi:hypothetical protein
VILQKLVDAIVSNSSAGAKKTESELAAVSE